MEKLKRNYYNSSEFNNIMVLIAAEQMLEGLRGLGDPTKIQMAEAFYERGIITKEQRRNLKMTHTYLKKFIDDIYGNADTKTKDKIDKKKYSFDFRLIDDYTVKQLYKITSGMETYSVNDEDFYVIVKAISEKNCRDCEKDRNVCPIQTVFEKYLVPPKVNFSDERTPNCEYAFLTEALSEK